MSHIRALVARDSNMNHDECERIESVFARQEHWKILIRNMGVVTTEGRMKLTLT